MALETRDMQCPYCGESIEIDIEPMDEDQTFIEDCSVCCRPIQYKVSHSDEGVDVVAEKSE